MKKFTILIALLFATFYVHAQNYSWAIGVRIGGSEGITLKKSLSQRSYFEGLLSINNSGFLATALWEIHNPFLSEPGFSWYYGAGGHFGAWDRDPVFFEDEDYAVGVDGILGVEYTFLELPFNIGLDWKPAFNIANKPGLYMANGALSLRFAF